MLNIIILYIVENVLLRTAFSPGIAGSAITYGCTPSGSREKLGATLLTDGVKVGHGFALEMLFTFILVFFVFSVTDPVKKVEPYGQTLGIGVCIWVCHVCLVS